MPKALRSVMPTPAAQPRARVVCDAQQHPGVVGQEAPARHLLETITQFSRNILLVSDCECRLAAGNRGAAAGGGQVLRGHRREPPMVGAGGDFAGPDPWPGEMLSEAAGRMNAFACHDLELDACWAAARRAHPAGQPPRRRLAALGGPLPHMVLGPSGYGPDDDDRPRRPALPPGQAHSQRPHHPSRCASIEDPGPRDLVEFGLQVVFRQSPGGLRRLPQRPVLATTSDSSGAGGCG